MLNCSWLLNFVVGCTPFVLCLWLRCRTAAFRCKCPREPSMRAAEVIFAEKDSTPASTQHMSVSGTEVKTLSTLQVLALAFLSYRGLA